MWKHKWKLAAAAILSGLIAVETMGVASATPLPIREAIPAYDKVQVEPVAYERNIYKRKWIRARDGSRYRYWRHGYRHYHNGYWYRTPWWLGVRLGVGSVRMAPANNHVAYCSSKYNSYNPATDLYLGYDGAFHRCVVP